jgi:tRNA (guanine-N(7)-)-methyltransferase
MGFFLSFFRNDKQSDLRYALLGMAFQNPYQEKLDEHSGIVFSLNRNNPKQDRLPPKAEWKTYFLSKTGVDPQKTILEIGCSNAHFLTACAQQEPNIGFVGCDWKIKIIYNAGTYIKKHSLKNIALLRANAIELQRAFGESEIDEIWIFFPDPWAKKSQLKNRLIQPQFLHEIYPLLKKSGKIYFKTDHPGYFQWVLAYFGIDSPSFNFNYEGLSSKEKRTRTNKQIEVRLPHSKDELPKPNQDVIKQFRCARYSTDFWKECAQDTSLIFSREKTLFEKSFLEQGLPVYFIELEVI